MTRLLIASFILIKFFSARFDLNTGQKIRTKVSIPKSMKVGEANYKFLSGIVHHGPSSHNGHYTCVAACPNGSLTIFDDGKVSFAHLSFCSFVGMCAIRVGIHRNALLLPHLDEKRTCHLFGRPNSYRRHVRGLL